MVSGTIVAINDIGGVAERLNALVLKTGRAQALVSSNLTPSAIFIFDFRFAIFDWAAQNKR